MRTNLWMTKLLGAALLGAALPAGAATITNLTVTNLSTPDVSYTGSLGRGEFRTANLNSSVTVSGAVTTIENRFGWLAAGQADGLQDSLLALGGTVAYEIGFTVEDPTNEGYMLIGSTATHGWMTAKWEGGANPDGEVGAESGGFDAEISVNGVYFPAGLLGSSDSVAAALSWLDSLNDLHAGSGSAFSGIQIGTKSFTLRMTGRPSRVYARAETSGGAALRFGLAATLAGLPYAETPGEDGESAELLGHFARIEVVSFAADTQPVPEPGGLGLAGLGLGLLAWGAARRGILTQRPPWNR